MWRTSSGTFDCVAVSSLPIPRPGSHGHHRRQEFGGARFEALYRVWLRRDSHALWVMQGASLRDQLLRGQGRVEFVELPHQYLQLTPLIGAAQGSRKRRIRRTTYRPRRLSSSIHAITRRSHTRASSARRLAPAKPPHAQDVATTIAPTGRRGVPPVCTPRRLLSVSKPWCERPRRRRGRVTLALFSDGVVHTTACVSRDRYAWRVAARHNPAAHARAHTAAKMRRSACA